MSVLIVALGSDHAGCDLKKRILTHLESEGITVVDVGVDPGQRGDYPVFAYRVASLVLNGDADRGVVICGSGIGASIAANKVRGIRCVVCSEPYSAMMGRRHNDTNVLALGQRVVGEELALLILDTWLSSDFEGGRHLPRLEMIRDIEGGLAI